MKSLTLIVALISIAGCEDASTETFSASECEISDTQLWITLDPKVGNPKGSKELNLDVLGVTFRNHSQYFAKTPDMLTGSHLTPEEIVLIYTDPEGVFTERVRLPTEECRTVAHKALALIPWLGSAPPAGPQPAPDR